MEAIAAQAIEPIRPTAFTIVHGDRARFSEELFSRFIDYTDRKPTTVRGYVTCIRQFMLWLHENGVTQPTREDIKRYRDHLAASDLAASTQSQYLRAVRHFFSWTSAEGLYPDISRNIHGAKVRRDVHKRDALPSDAVVKIAETIDRTSEEGRRLYAMYLLCVVNGTRTVELHRANVEDLKTIGGVRYIYLFGKGRDEADAPEVLIEPVADAIDDYLAHRTEPVKPKTPLFTSTSNRNKGGRIATTTISSQLKQVLVNAGYDSDRLTAHSLRHTSGTGAHKAGIDLYGVQHLMRHADPATSEIYIHDDESANAEIKGRTAIYSYFFDGKEATPLLPELEAELATMSQDEQRELLRYIKEVKRGE